MIEGVFIVFALLFIIFSHVFASLRDRDEYGRREYKWWGISATTISVLLLTFSICYASIGDWKLSSRNVKEMKRVTINNSDSTQFFHMDIFGKSILSTSNGTTVQEPFGWDTTVVITYHDMRPKNINDYYVYCLDKISFWNLPKTGVKVLVSTRPIEKYELLNFIQSSKKKPKIEKKK